MGRIWIRVTLGVVDGVSGVVQKVLPKMDWYRYWQYFSAAVLVLVSAILFCQSIAIGIDNSFHKYW